MIKDRYYDNTDTNKSKSNRIKNHYPNEHLKTESLTCRLDKTILNKLKNEA